MRVHGSMLLTTPNACSLPVLDRALRLERPWQYPFHFRVAYLRDNGLDVAQRGDDMFLLAERTDTLPEPRGTLDLPI